MMDSIDIPLGHGWHMTIFHPWVWLLVGATVVAVVTLVGRTWLTRP